MHAYGNLLIHPFNFDDDKNSMLMSKKEYRDFATLYDEIWTENGFPKGNIKGNGPIAIGY